MDEIKTLNICLPSDLLDRMDRHLTGRYGNRSAFLTEAIKNQMEIDVEREKRLAEETQK